MLLKEQMVNFFDLVLLCPFTPPIKSVRPAGMLPAGLWRKGCGWADE